MITLLVRQGTQPEVEVTVEGNIARVGRVPGSQVQLVQEHVSKRHLRVLKGIVIVDLASRNGTYIDGKRIKEPVLYTGGEIRIGEGDVYMRIRLDDPEDKLGGTPTAVALSESAILRRSAERQLESVSGENTRLAGQLADARKQLAELEERERARNAERAEPSPAQRMAEEALVSARAEVGSAQAEIASAQAEILRAQAELARAQTELVELRAQLTAAQEAKPVVPTSPAAELFLKLQSENTTLKRRLAEISAKTGTGAAAPTPAPPANTPAKLLAELVELRAQNAALRAQAGGVSRPVPVAPNPTGDHKGSNVRALFMRLAKDDVDRQPPLLTGSVEEFLVVEQFRFVRNVERIVTRMAGEFFQLLEGKTMLPDVQGMQDPANLRQLIARVGDPADIGDARAELMQYSAQLSRWLVAALGANRKAAGIFAQKLKTDLGEQALTASAPIPVFKRLSGGREAELWRRTGLYLRELTPDMVEDQLEKLSRAAALELFGDGGAVEAAKAD